MDVSPQMSGGTCNPDPPPTHAHKLSSDDHIRLTGGSCLVEPSKLNCPRCGEKSTLPLPTSGASAPLLMPRVRRRRAGFKKLRPLRSGDAPVLAMKAIPHKMSRSSDKYGHEKRRRATQNDFADESKSCSDHNTTKNSSESPGLMD